MCSWSRLNRSSDFGDNQIEPLGASVPEQGLVARSERRCAAYSVIHVGLHHGPAVTLDVSGAHPDLVVD